MPWDVANRLVKAVYSVSKKDSTGKDRKEIIIGKSRACIKG